MTEETHNLRKSLIAAFMSKKGDRIQQKVQQKIETSFKDWESILNDYINITMKLNNLVRLAEQHNQVSKLRYLLNQSTELIEASSGQFANIATLIERILPMSNLNMDSIVKQEARLSKMKESLAQVLLFSCNRDVIEVVQKMMLQVTEIQQKINFASNKVRDVMHDVIKCSSKALHVEPVTTLPSFAADDEEEDISMISTNSNGAE